MFYSPVATLYRQSAGLSLLQMGVIESLSLALMLALEIPWGVLADRLGHRRTLAICSVLFALSKVVFWQARTFFGFLTERLVLSVVLSGLTGCDSAYLFSCCGGTGEHRRAFSHWEAATVAGTVLAGLTWPLLEGDYRLAALLTVGTYAAAALLTLLLTDPAGTPPARRERAGFRAALRQTWRMAPILLAFCLLAEAAQQVTVCLNQLQYLRAGIPERWFGPLYALATGAGLAGGLSHRLTGRLGTRRAGGLLFLTAAGVCLVLALTDNPTAAVSGVLLMAAVRAAANPLSLSIQNENAPEGGRAAQLSCNAMLMDAAALGVYPVYGALADRGVPGALLLACGCCTLGLLLFWRGMGRQSLAPQGPQPGVDTG